MTIVKGICNRQCWFCNVKKLPRRRWEYRRKKLNAASAVDIRGEGEKPPPHIRAQGNIGENLPCAWAFKPKNKKERRSKNKFIQFAFFGYILAYNCEQSFTKLWNYLEIFLKIISIVPKNVRRIVLLKTNFRCFDEKYFCLYFVKKQQKSKHKLSKSPVLLSKLQILHFWLGCFFINVLKE